MKKLLSLILVICLCFAATAAFAEEDEEAKEEFGVYTDDNPEALAFYSVWVADNGDWRFGLHYKQDTVSGDWDETYYENGDAEFSLTEDGKLLWKDLLEDAGNGLEFTKIGNFFGGRWMKDEIEVIFYEWYDDEYDIRLYVYGENNEIVKNAILKGSYDAATDSLTATGEFDDEEPFTVTFTYDEHNNVVWTENGESTVMEYSYRTDDY